MENKLKEHFILFLVITFFIHLITGYIFGSFNPKDLGEYVRQCEILSFITLQVIGHYVWFNRVNIAKDLKV